MLLKRISLRLIVLVSLAANVFGITGVFLPTPVMQSGSSTPPILLVVNRLAPNRFGAYLAQTSLSSTQASPFSNYVSNGGASLAMRPDTQIAGLFGLASSAGTLTSDAHWNNASTDYPLFFSDLNTYQGKVTLYLSAEASDSWLDNVTLQTIAITV